MWVLEQSCQVSATEEVEANGMVGSTILCCSVAQRVIKQKIIANSLSDVSYSFMRLHVAPHEWWEMCLLHRVQENVGDRAGLPSEKPYAKNCSNVKLCCVCVISHYLTRVTMLQRRPSGPHFQQGWFPHALIMVCWSTGSNGWELCVFHDIELLYLWAPPESLSVAGFPLKPSTPAAFIKHFPSSPPTPPGLHIKTLGCLVMSAVSSSLGPEVSFALPSTHYCLSPFLCAVGCLTQMSWPDPSCPNACSIHACSKYDTSIIQIWSFWRYHYSMEEICETKGKN